MAEYSKALGDCVYRKRKGLRWTQAYLAERSGVTEQTIRKIEHYNANPQMDVLYSLVNVLQLDPTEIFYPQFAPCDLARKQLEIVLADCSDEQIRELLPVIEAALEIVKGQSLTAAR